MSIKAVGIAIKLTLEGINQIWYRETWFFCHGCCYMCRYADDLP